MAEGIRDAKWLALCGGQGHSAVIEGWYPPSFDWNIKTLHNHQSELRKLKILLGIRPGQNGAEHPEVLFDQLPVPIFPADDYVIEMFSPYWEGFATVPVQTGIAQVNRFKKWAKSLVLVPLPAVQYNSSSDVPESRHMAVIADRFCITTELLEDNAFYFRGVVTKPIYESIVLPPPATPDFSAIFVKREKCQEPLIEVKIIRFILASLQQYQSQLNAPLGGILLDCDPQYGYVILALKQTPIINKAQADIDEFELEQFSILEAAELYGHTEYLPASRFRALIKRVIERVATHDLVRSLAGSQTLHIAYAFHDEDVHWIAEV